MSAAIEQRNQAATAYVGNLDDKVNEELLWELMLQAGPVVNVFMPKDKVSGKTLNYGFVEFRTEDDAEYAIKVMNMIKVYQRPIKVNPAQQDKKIADVGANLFIGNIDPEVDEKLLYDTFSAFGGITQTPNIVIDAETGLSKGYGFVSYDSFEAADLAIECMHQQFLANRPIVVQYAFKKDTPGERHGSQAERILAASQPKKLKPHTHFSSGQGDTTSITSGASLAFYEYQQQQQQQLQLQMQQMQMQQHMNPAMMPMGGVGITAMGLSSVQQRMLPMQMQTPMGMMPSAPGTLPQYMTAATGPAAPLGNGAIPPPPPPLPAFAALPPVPPPPPAAGDAYDPAAADGGGAAFPPPPMMLPPPPPPPPAE